MLAVLALKNLTLGTKISLLRPPVARSSSDDERQWGGALLPADASLEETMSHHVATAKRAAAAAEAAAQVGDVRGADAAAAAAAAAAPACFAKYDVSPVAARASAVAADAAAAAGAAAAAAALTLEGVRVKLGKQWPRRTGVRSLYLLYWYKSTNTGADTDAAHPHLGVLVELLGATRLLTYADVC